MDLCLLIESSDLVTSEAWSASLDLLSVLMDILSVGEDETRVGAMSFSNEVHLLFPLNKYSKKRDVKTALGNSPFLGNFPNISQALEKAKTDCFSVSEGDRPQVENVLVIVTSGRTAGPQNRAKALQTVLSLKGEDITVIPAGNSPKADLSMLRAMSQPPHEEGKNYFLFENIGFKNIEAFAAHVVEELCTILLGTYSSSFQTTNFGHSNSEPKRIL